MSAVWQIYFNYGRSDELFACRLADDLHRSGASIWLDTYHARPGRHWARSIEQALTDSAVMVVILSPDALRTRHVALAWQAYLEAYRPVIPVLALPCEPPGLLRTRRPVDFSREHLYGRNYHQLMTRLIESRSRSRRGGLSLWGSEPDLLPFVPEMIPPVRGVEMSLQADFAYASHLVERPAPEPVPSVLHTLRGLRSRLLGGGR